MANTLSNVLPTVYEALYGAVAREFVGAIGAVRRDSGVEGAAKDQTISFPIVPQGSLENITPGQLPANSGDVTPTSGTMTLNNSKAYPIRWNGEEQVSLRRGDNPQYNEILRQQFEQGFRTFANSIESDIAGLYSSASRAYGTAGTTPFATIDELDDASEVLRILEDNGAPRMDNHLVLNSAAIAKLRGYQGVMFKANEGQERGSNALGELFGLDLHMSKQIKSHTKGTGASYLLNDASSAVGDTTIAADTGTGTILAGDIVTFAGTADKYVVASALSGGSFTIGAPGLVVAETDNDAITVGNSYTANMAFHRNAIILGTRPPAVPDGGDAADDRTIITDPVSGLSFSLSVYREYYQTKYEIGLVWGVKAVRPEYIALLLG